MINVQPVVFWVCILQWAMGRVMERLDFTARLNEDFFPELFYVNPGGIIGELYKTFILFQITDFPVSLLMCMVDS